MVTQRWFDLVKATKEKWGILDNDMYNFDETGFMMGKILSRLVITSSECGHMCGNKGWNKEIRQPW